MTVSMGVGLFPTEPPHRMVALAAAAEQLGYDNVWFGDSQNLWREAYVTMTLAAEATTTVTLGTGVTQALTRHPSVLASAWATLHEVAPGRLALGIGTGDSAVRTMGLDPMRLAALEQTISDLRDLLAGEEVDEPVSGGSYRLGYLTDPIELPIYVAASGPRITELTGSVADGVILLVGTDPRFIESGLERLEAGARASGRTLDDLHVVLWTPTAIDDDGDAARALVRAHVARVVIRDLPADLPPESMQAVARLREAYRYKEHLATTAGHADLVPDELIPHFAMAGTRSECLPVLRAIARLPVDQVAIVPFTAAGGDRAATMRAFAELVAAL